VPAKPLAVIDAQEIERRINLVTSTAPEGRGGLVCKFCGKSYNSPRNLRRHLERIHLDELKAMRS
jgi:hypothetical protein